MTKHEADVIGCLNMTDQISTEAYEKIMIAAQDENEVGEVLDEIRAEIEELAKPNEFGGRGNGKSVRYGLCKALEIIDKYRAESEGNK